MFPNERTVAELISMINEVDDNVYAEAKKTFTEAFYQRVMNVSNIAFPSGIEFDDIQTLTINNRMYSKADVRTPQNEMLPRYFERNGKIEIRPIPDSSDIEYVSGASEITFGTDTITTTGDDFSGFAIGDIIIAKDSVLETSNNKQALIVGVTTKVLSVNPSTFTAQAEVAAITIQRPRIVLTYLSKPTHIDATSYAATDMKIPDRYLSVYDYWLMSRIHFLAKDYADAENCTRQFDMFASDYVKWYKNREGVKPIQQVQVRGWHKNARYSIGSYE